MSIKINTDNSTFALNASRVEKFMTAKTRDQALHMGVLDRFKDFFRATDEKKSVQIAKIYDSITTSDSNAASPVVIAERFKRLRDLATDEAKPQFLIESQKDDGSNMWSYALSIGPDRIHQSPKMLDTYNESFESLSNYQKYFHGVDTVTAAPEAITDLNSSLQGVLHAMTADSTDTSAVLRALDQTVAILHPKLINPSDEEIRSVFLARGYSQENADTYVELYKTNPYEVGILLAREEDVSGEKFLQPIKQGIDKLLMELPKQQHLSMHDFFKTNDYFANGLHESGRPAMAVAVDTLEIDSHSDPRVGLVGAKAALLNDCGLISKLIFEAVELSLQQDIYRTSSDPTLAWRVDNSQDMHPPQEFVTLAQEFLSSNQNFANLLSRAKPHAPNISSSIDAANQGNADAARAMLIEPSALKV